MKIVNEDGNRKLGMDVLPRGVVKRKLNPNGLGHKIHNSRNRKRCFVCNTYDNVIYEQIVMFEHKTSLYVCKNCKDKKVIDNMKGDVRHE